MAMIGMDVEEIETVAQQLHSQAEQIGQVISTIEGLIGQAEGAWKGDDAARFKDEWGCQHRPALQQAQQAIENLGTAARNNAARQRDTSSSYA